MEAIRVRLSSPPAQTEARRAPFGAADYAERLLAATPARGAALPASPRLDPGLDSAREWARSGAMALTGDADGPPALAPGPLALAARGASLALAALAPGSEALAGLDGPALLGERAALAGLGRRGEVAPGGHCRLLPARDGWLALNLARPDDRDLLPAWLEAETPAGEDPWDFVRRRLASRSLTTWVERGRMMGLALAACETPDPNADPNADPDPNPEPWLHAEPLGAPRPPPPPHAAPLVVDLSALWAGPLCTQLLAFAGARVIKVESAGRPDGARQAGGDFFDLLNAGKASVALDLGDHAERQRLQQLIDRADIVVESARPRALAQWGIDARAPSAQRPGRVWLSITGHGRAGERGNWVGFGDDAAIAAGAAVRRGDRPLFCGDAIADPLTGLHAAVAALAHFRAGRGALLDVSLAGVTRWALAANRGEELPARVEAAQAGAPIGRVTTPQGSEAVAPPRARPIRERAAELGADNPRILAGSHPWTMPERRAR